MSPSPARLTAADQILIASATLAGEFSEWDLTIACWRHWPDRFGMPGHEHPDHKRVSMEIMGDKPHNPVRCGYLVRTRPSHYRLTPTGKALAAALEDSPELVYGFLLNYLNAPQLIHWKANPDEPRDPYEARKFLAGLPFAEVRAQTKRALDWCKRHRVEWFVAPRRVAIDIADVAALADFLTALEYRFPELTGRAGAKVRTA